MKLRHLKTTVAAAVAALVLSTVAAQAAITYNSGDVFLGFRQSTNSTSDFVVNLGAGSALRDATSPIVFTLTNINSMLTGLFGAGYAADPTVTFGLIGTTQNTANAGDLIRTLYVSEPIGNPAPVNTSNQSGPANNILAFKAYVQGLPESSVSNGTIGSPGDSNSFSARVQGSFGSVNIQPIEGNVATGLELFRLPQTGAASGGNTVTDEGTFAYTGGDTFTFTPTAVPEPSTWGLGGLLVLGLAFHRHRKSVVA